MRKDAAAGAIATVGVVFDHEPEAVQVVVGVEIPAHRFRAARDRGIANLGSVNDAVVQRRPGYIDTPVVRVHHLVVEPGLEFGC